ncbi:hypothetical protein F8M41_006288 [Gigaspora margarita]|uniref:Uncharacterized protein n=1 Tax=Gigaspora margarita TaxID=4874 RepID=A0A8H3X6R0_GIGMA|nr:hypothetical protein F8M41_006288 [Gigaspora margarita]
MNLNSTAPLTKFIGLQVLPLQPTDNRYTTNSSFRLQAQLATDGFRYTTLVANGWYPIIRTNKGIELLLMKKFCRTLDWISFMMILAQNWPKFIYLSYKYRILPKISTTLLKIRPEL